MHAGYAYPDAAVVTITPSPTGDLTVSQQVDASYRRLIVYFDTGNDWWFTVKKQGCHFMVALEIPNSVLV